MDRSMLNLPAWATQLIATLDHAPRTLVTRTATVILMSDRAPWTATPLHLHEGDQVTWFASGETHLVAAPAIRMPAALQIWARIGACAPIFRGTQVSHSFTVSQPGPLALATYFPGEWASPDGTLATPPEIYATAAGKIVVVLVQWAPGIGAAAGLARLAALDLMHDLIAAERARLATPDATPPGWHYLWSLGPAEIFHADTTAVDVPCIHCQTHDDVGILQYPVSFACEPGSRLRWRWKVDALPSQVAEDTVPTHDYLSIAVEFDDGQDVTYYWSAALPIGTTYRCPLPNWAGRETHVVQRSGVQDVGRWCIEEVDLHADYQRIFGRAPGRVVRVWLIAVSLFQKGIGRCQYTDITLDTPRGELRVL